MSTSFLTSDVIWQVVKRERAKSKRVSAAFAFWGRSGSKLIPLKRNDTLVADVSLKTVRSGGTDPFEIERLQKKGVAVYTRGNLHAKLVLFDKSLLVGSANASLHSRDALDEAALLTTDPVAIANAKQFLTRICTEPVRPKYLAECKRAYRPPSGQASRAEAAGTRQTPRAKLWVVNVADANEIPLSKAPNTSAASARPLRSGYGRRPSTTAFTGHPSQQWPTGFFKAIGSSWSFGIWTRACPSRRLHNCC